jgi:biotin carboxyl carrier protein
MHYQARIGDRTIEIDVDGDRLTVDGRPAEFHLERIGPNTVALLLDGRSHVFTLEPQDDGQVRVTGRGRRLDVLVKDERALLLEQFGLADAAGAAERELRSPMPGLVVSIAVQPGQEVKPGDGLVVLEAMKMENELRATAAATVQSVHVAPGDAVGKNALLITFE